MPILLPVHIISAGLGILAGFIALAVKKGGFFHRKSGLAFVVAMVAMCASGFVMALVKAQAMNAIAAVMTAYLAVTSLMTVRPARCR